MKVLITDNANNDIREFVNFSIASDKNIYSYVHSLLKYIYTLEQFPELGKFEFKLKTKMNVYFVRKLVYEQHNILYYIDDKIHIIGIIHSKKDINQYINKLKKFIDFI